MSTDKQNTVGSAPADASTESADEPTPEPSRPVRWARRIIPVLILALVAGIAARELHTLNIHTVRAALGAVSLPALLGLQVLALTSVLAMSLYDWQAARTLVVPMAPRTLIRNAWIANAFNNLIGLSGLAGSGIRMLLMTRDRIDTRAAAAFSALIMASAPVGLAALSWPLLLAGAPAAERLPIPAWTAWLALGMFASYLPLYILLLHRGLLARALRGLVAQSPASLLVMIAISTLDWLLAAGVAWIALELGGAAVSWPHFLIGFVLASALGILSLIPGGLGVFDTTLVVLLTPFSQGAEHIVGGVLLYRLCYYLVPWFIAIYLGADRLLLTERGQRVALAQVWRESRLANLVRFPLNLLASLGMRVLSYLTFSGGVLLLVSAAFPALTDRIVILHEYVPLVATNISHMLSVGAGVLLIALSRGIARQVQSAYYLTQALLVAGAIFTFFKGIDYEEATILLTVALLLRRQRDHFYRESYPLFGRRNLLWLASLVGAVLGFAWLGDRINGDIPLAWNHLSWFGTTLEAPRFTRGVLVAATAATAFIGWSFYSRPKFYHAMADPETLADAEKILIEYGGSALAHLTFLGDKRILWAPDHKAFIQYGVIRDRLIALGDPCGAPRSFDAAIIAFRDFADRYDLVPCFYEVGEANIHRYHDAGFALFKLGETALVTLADFTIAGKRGESLRHSLSRAKRDGAEFELLEQPLAAPLWVTLRAVSDAWLTGLGGAEKGFSLGNFNEDYLRRSPIAVVRIEGQIVAFANLMPDYGRHEELSIDLMRHHPDAPSGTMDFLFIELLLYARTQGYRYFNLGMAPLGGVGETRYARAGERVAGLAFQYGNRFYNYKGLRGFKEKYHPEWRSTYFAYPVLTALPALLMDSAALIAGGYRRIVFKPDRPGPSSAHAGDNRTPTATHR